MMKNIKLYTLILFTFITLQTYGMNLFVQTPNNGTISLDVEPSDSGENIKNKIFDQISIPVINQVISWNGTTIQDGQTLADFGIVNNSTIVLTVTTTTQVPEKMSYQAVVRNAANQLVINQNVGIKFSILKSSATGTVVYAETQNSTTNSNGLFTTNIGSGTVISGSMASINWANDVYFIKSEIDLAGGSNYTITGTQQLLSVPYALNAKNGIPNGGTANQVLAKVDGTNYNTTWVTPASGSADNLGNHTATQALNMSNQNITNANTTTTAQLNTSEISIGSTSTTIALTNINATSSDIDATGKSYIFIQSAISQYHVIHGIAGGYAGKILYLGTAAGTTWVNNSATETIATNRLSNIFINANAQSAGTGFHIFKLLYMTNVSGGRWVVIDQDL